MHPLSFLYAFSDTHQKHKGKHVYDEMSKICDHPARIDLSRNTDIPKWVVCRKCKKCVQRRHTDLAGRAMAESLMNDHTVAVTLTYGPHVGSRSQYLFYRDVQLMLKRLRKDGYKVRYIVSGEYGTKRARAHWHAVLFFKGAMPEMPPVETQKQNWKYWVDSQHNFSKGNGPVPLGYVFVQRPDFHGIRYVVKYAVKDDATGKSTRSVQMSLKPPLGALYWHKAAAEEVRDRVPFRFTYMLPECKFANGNPVQFYAQEASARLKWRAYREAWVRKYRTSPPVHIDAIETWYRVVVPPKIRAYTTDPKMRIPFKPGKDTYARLKRFGKYALIKLNSGDMVCMKYNGSNEALSLWRVENLAEAIALARGRAVRPPQILLRGEIPF